MNHSLPHYEQSLKVQKPSQNLRKLMRQVQLLCLNVHTSYKLQSFEANLLHTAISLTPSIVWSIVEEFRNEEP